MALNWKRAKANKLPKTNILDENDYLKRDEAAKWLAVNEERSAKKATKKLKPKKNAYRQQSVKLIANHARAGIVIYTDGACEPNPGVGGWAYVVYENGAEIHSECGGDVDTTNNVMEMTAVLRALQWLKDNQRSSGSAIYSDSQYVVKGCTLWRHRWRKRGWKRGCGGVVANVELWKELSSVLDTMKVRIEWCKGHAGIIGNERADSLSVEGRQSAAEPDEPSAMIVEQLRYSF